MMVSLSIIRHGEILAPCTPRQAIDQLKESVWEATVPREQVAALKSRCQVISSQMFGGLARLQSDFKRRATERRIYAETAPVPDYYFDLVSQPNSHR